MRSFADPSVNFALEFATPERPEAAPRRPPLPRTPADRWPPPPRRIAPPDKPAGPQPGSGKAEEKIGAEVVTLDSFRKR